MQIPLIGVVSFYEIAILVRIHCQNLLLHSVNEQKAIANMTEGEAKTNRKRNVQILDTLFEDTGCKRQICTQLNELIPKARFDTAKDDIVMYQYYVE